MYQLLATMLASRIAKKRRNKKPVSVELFITPGCRDIRLVYPDNYVYSTRYWLN